MTSIHCIAYRLYLVGQNIRNIKLYANNYMDILVDYIKECKISNLYKI